MAELTRNLHRAFYPSRLPGDREPLLLLNSLATTTEIWAPMMSRLTASTSVLCVDYPGHGLSPAREMPADLDDLAASMLEVLDEFGIERVHVAGVSIGGMAALRLAELAPDRIASITVIGSTPVMDRRMWQARKELVQQWGTRGIVPDVLERWFTSTYATAYPDVVAQYTTMLEGTADSAYAAFCDVLGPADLRSVLSAISCPTLVVSGSHDAAATVEDGRTIVDAVPHARHVVVDGAAHMLQAMATDAVADLILEQVGRGT
ncbi:alpha/beta fold hydrolase [Isoptericola sp. AK164]|uniref:alpha/beta fold hydrolase n=1 Tax=Isoptericola sp. AK164 TaxID=3024246 RepID=UPI002418B940|nr:alpha/beta fold hydrolase [Isoptericola sp. AK164]